jgi:solute carrier family 25 uncoupling protein 8/9
MSSDMGKSGPILELRRTISEEGIKALWKGVGPAMARAAALTASQLATYDETKQVNFLKNCIFVDLFTPPPNLLSTNLFCFLLIQILVKWTSLREGFHLHLMYGSPVNFISSYLS